MLPMLLPRASTAAAASIDWSFCWREPRATRCASADKSRAEVDTSAAELLTWRTRSATVASMRLNSDAVRPISSSLATFRRRVRSPSPFASSASPADISSSGWITKRRMNRNTISITGKETMKAKRMLLLRKLATAALAFSSEMRMLTAPSGVPAPT